MQVFEEEMLVWLEDRLMFAKLWQNDANFKSNLICEMYYLVKSKLNEK